LKIYEYIIASIQHPERCEDASLVFAGGERGEASVFAVIDGMGGHQHVTASGETLTGRDASQTARQVLIEDLENLPPDVSAAQSAEAETRLIAALERANDQMYSALNGGEGSPLHERVGAVGTVAVLCEGGARLLFGQVGDTRAYIYSDGELFQLLKDEDNVQYMVNQGQMSEEDADRVTQIVNVWDGQTEPDVPGSVNIGGQRYDTYLAWRWFVTGNPALRIPGANVVINALGTEPGPVQVQRSRYMVAQGDMLLLCSDGLYKNLSEAEIVRGLAEAADPATTLGEAAYARSKDKNNQRCNPDDITAVVVRF